MPTDQPATAAVLALIPREKQPRDMTAGERSAYESGRAAALRELMRDRYGGVQYDPLPPISLSETALKHWQQGLKAIPLPLRRAGCEDALCRYAVAMATFERASAELDRMGLLLKGRAGEAVRNPLTTVRASAMVQIREARRELGFPTSWVEKNLRPKRK